MGFIQASGWRKINSFQQRMFAQLGAAQDAFQLAVFTFRHFMINQQSQPFVKAQGLGGWLCKLQMVGIRHGIQFQQS